MGHVDESSVNRVGDLPEARKIKNRGYAEAPAVIIAGRILWPACERVVIYLSAFVRRIASLRKVCRKICWLTGKMAPCADYRRCDRQV
jgi:hypothetical protein